MDRFDPIDHLHKVVAWTKDFLKDTEDKPIIIGISGGKDSTITTATLIEAVGRERIRGIMLPNGDQKDIHDAYSVCKYFDIKHDVINISNMYQAMLQSITLNSEGIADSGHFNRVVTTNAPCRCRMVMLYTIANQLHGRVANTCNMSESYVGYDTKFGDQCGDFGIYQDYTATEEIMIGRAMRVPENYLAKTPDDGMCGQSDEERWGFTYAYLDDWLRSGRPIINSTDMKIAYMHKCAEHKLDCVKIPHPEYRPEGSHYLDDVFIGNFTGVEM